MLANPDLAAARFLIAALAIAAGLVAGLVISRRSGWAPAGWLALIAAAPLIPSLPIVLGISTDDLLPAIGAVAILGVAGLRPVWEARWPRLLVLGAALMLIAGALSAVANASGLVSGVSLALRGAGAVAYLGLVAASVAAALPADRRRLFVARAIAVVATAEGAFGLVAWLLPLPFGAGLEPARQMTSLLGAVPGRVAGTTGLSPNFLGALFVLSIPITAALALRAEDRRARLGWWAAVAVQVVALALTFTRTSLVLGMLALIALLLLRGHGRTLLVLGALVVGVTVLTPLGARMLGDANDRMALWTSSVRMFVDHPVAGVGTGRTLEVAEANPERYRHTPFGEATNNAHNTILRAAAETGIAGGAGSLLVNLSVALCALTAVLAFAGPGRMRQGLARGPTSDLVLAAALGTLGFLVQGMTNNLFAVRVTGVTFILVVAAFLIPPPASLRALLTAGRGRADEGVANPGYRQDRAGLADSR